MGKNGPHQKPLQLFNLVLFISDVMMFHIITLQFEACVFEQQSGNFLFRKANIKRNNNKGQIFSCFSWSTYRMTKKGAEMTHISKTETKSRQQSFDSVMDGDESNQISANVFEVLCLSKFTNLFRKFGVSKILQCL